MNSNFLLLSKSERLINYYNKLLINFPNKEYVLKNNIETTSYKLIENIFSYNINTTDRIKQKYLKDLLINLSMLDFYSKVSFNKKIISKRQFEVVVRAIIEIRKITYGVIKIEQTKESWL